MQKIFDVGVNDGADTAFYLSQGFRVIGIEASPSMAEHLRQKFRAELDDARFILIEAGIGAANGTADFWVCDDHSDWSSFDKAVACRNGARHHSVRVTTRRFDDILDEHGVPFYCKIDIEGHDRLCLEQMDVSTAPDHLSIEMAHSDGIVDLERLRELSYARFKIISQTSFAQPKPLLRRLTSQFNPAQGSRLLRLERLAAGVTKIGDWSFRYGSSGPFGEMTAGPWRTFDEAAELWHFLHTLDHRNNAGGIGDWYDIHAAK